MPRTEMMTTDLFWREWLNRSTAVEPEELPGLGRPRYSTFVNSPDMGQLLEFMMRVFSRYRLPRYWGGQG